MLNLHALGIGIADDIVDHDSLDAHDTIVRFERTGAALFRVLGRQSSGLAVIQRVGGSEDGTIIKMDATTFDNAHFRRVIPLK